MKRILLPFLFFASVASAHPEQLWVIHPQANVQYPCPYGSPINICVQTACSYATPYGCRVISHNHDTYFIETYVQQTYIPPPVVVVPPPAVFVPSPVVVMPPVFSWIQVNPPQPNHGHRHRPARRR
jgi:hypothetical protein